MKLCSFHGCENYTEGQTSFCASHNHQLRKEARESLKEPKKRKPLVRVSEKKAEKIKPYAILRRNYLKENPICEANIPGICDTYSKEIHHASRSELDFLEVSTWRAVCRTCHDYLERRMTSQERRRRNLLIDPVNKKFDGPHKI